MSSFEDFLAPQLAEVARLYSAAVAESDLALAQTLQSAAQSLAMSQAESAYAAALIDFASRASLTRR